MVNGFSSGTRSDSPEPGQYVGRENRDSSSRCNTGESLFRARLSMCELIAANHNCDQAGDFRDRTGEQVLHGGKARVKGRSAPCLRVRGGRHDEKKQEDRFRVLQHSKVLPTCETFILDLRLCGFDLVMNRA